MFNLSPFQVIILAVFAALAVSGVLIFALVVGGAGGGGTGPVVVWGTQDEGPITVVLRQASEEDRRLSQVSYVQQDAATYEADLTEALANGLGPDVFLLRQDYAIKNSGKVFPIPYDFLPRSQFEDVFIAAADPYLGENGVTGIPLLVDPLVMYWNRDLVESAGFATPPQYWDELSAFSQKVVSKNETGGIQKAAIAFGEYQNVDHAKDIFALLVLQADGFITARDGTGRLIPALSARSAGARQPAESALRFYTGFADPSRAGYSWNRAMPDSRAAFLAGDLALYIGYASEELEIARANPNLNFAAAPVPQSRISESKLNVARVYALAVARTSRNPQGAITAASLMTETAVARAFSIALGLPSARRDVLSSRFEGKDDFFEGQALIARSWSDPDPQGTADMFRDMIEGVTSGASRLAEAVSRANQELAQIIGQE